jgi:hypothetical protein
MSSIPHSEDEATVSLTADEAIVLFDMLSRWSMDGESPTPPRECFESTAEGAVLNKLLCELESRLVAPFRPDYLQILQEARKRTECNWDYPTLRG